VQHQQDADEAEREAEPLISAETPAGTPWLMAMNTPPR